VLSRTVCTGRRLFGRRAWPCWQSGFPALRPPGPLRRGRRSRSGPRCRTAGTCTFPSSLPATRHSRIARRSQRRQAGRQRFAGHAGPCYARSPATPDPRTRKHPMTGTGTASGLADSDIVARCRDAVATVDTLYRLAHAHVAGLVTDGGRIAAALIDREQRAVHGLAWLATYAESLRQLVDWAGRLEASGNLGELERLILQAGTGEYLNQIVGGIPMSQTEFVRPHELGLDAGDLGALSDGAAGTLARHGNSAEARARIAGLLVDHDGSATFGNPGTDETLEQMRDEIRRYIEARVAPHAHRWHLDNAYVPMEIVHDLAELGVFALTLPEEWGGLGLGKVAMCVVSEELSRGWIAVGSLGTRSEIAAELILHGGTEAQKARWLPAIASGKVLLT